MSLAGQQAPAKRGDRFSILYFVFVFPVFLLFAAGDDLDRVYHLYLLLVPILFLPALALFIFLLVALLRNAWSRRWRRVVSVIAAPLLAYSFFATAAARGIDSKWIRFHLYRDHYFNEIARLPETGAPKFKKFDWGSTGGVAVQNVFWTLIYDESDEILRPPEARSDPWTRRVREELCAQGKQCEKALLEPKTSASGSDWSVSIRKIEGHFYLVTQSIG